MAAPSSFHVFMLDDLFPAPSDGLTMCSTLWSNLPVDLVEPILVRLPTSSQARFQAVCKTWRRLLRSQDFTNLSAAMAFSSGRYLAGFVRSHLPLDLKQSDRHVLDLQAQGAYKVHHLSLEFLPTHHRCLIFKQGLIVTGRMYRSGIMGSRQHTVELCVVNPVNRTWRELPDLRVHDDKVRTPLVCPDLAVDDAGRGFQVTVRVCSTYMLEGVDRDRDITWVYSSDCNAWSRVQDGSDEADMMDDDQSEDSDIDSLELDLGLDVAQESGEYTVRGETFFVPAVWEEPDETEAWDGVQDGSDEADVMDEAWDVPELPVPLSMPKELMAQVRLPLPWMRRFFRAAIEEYYRDHPEEVDDAVDADGVDIQDWWGYEEVRTDPCRSHGQLVGEVIFITVCTTKTMQVVAYHVVQQSWQMVLSDRGRCLRPDPAFAHHYPPVPPYFHSWQKVLLERSWWGQGDDMGMSFLQLRPGFDCGLN